MARKPSKAALRQALAKRKALAYVRRLGLRKAANRLNAKVSELRNWLETRFPGAKLDPAIGLGTPGGLLVGIPGTGLQTAGKKLGWKKLSKLTGIPRKQLQTDAKRAGRVVFDRKKLRAAVQKIGHQKLAELLGTKPRAILVANKIPLTESARRLGKFTKKFGEKEAANYLGISPARLSRWVKTGIPSNWERNIVSAIGRRVEDFPDEEIVKAKKPKLEKRIASALKKVSSWNKKTKKRRFRISKAQAEQWARLGTFEKNWKAIKEALATSKKKVKTTRPKPPPRKAPSKPVFPPGFKPAPKKKKFKPPGKEPKKPQKVPEVPPEKPLAAIPEEKKRNFLEARSEAFIEGRYPEPPVAWDILKSWSLINRQGVHVFRKVQKFVHELELDKIAEKIISDTQRVWEKLPGDDRAFLTVRMTFSVMGDGNPFYPDAFIDGDSVNFITRNIQIYDISEIEQEVRSIMQEIYMVDLEETMLFFEHYEIIKSIPK